jgi:hypothetical protein
VNPYTPEYEYTSILHLVINDGNVTGNQIWKAVQSPLPSVGNVAVEYLAGTYNHESRLLEMSGTHKDDPKGIIALDKYQLTLSKDSLSLSGKTLADGNWEVSKILGTTDLKPYTTWIRILNEADRGMAQSSPFALTCTLNRKIRPLRWFHRISTPSDEHCQSSQPINMWVFRAFMRRDDLPSWPRFGRKSSSAAARRAINW